ncbi:uncharacterized protein LOC132155508 [Carassius carassius]|uniref:uncharacterized protein LOC132155508 n=1 Tax=Carassius carassius TaxID=217509 RepID=UPI002869688F|nr:uncharacterized protein LOC132155508 [Carassius carassius]
MAANPAPLRCMTTNPAPRGKMEASITPQCKMAASSAPTPRMAADTLLYYFEMLSRILDVPKTVHVMAAELEPQHKVAASPAPQHKMAASPEPQHKMAASLEPQHKMAAGPAPQHKMAASPEPQHKMATSPAPQHKMADSTPESPDKVPPTRHHRGWRRRRQAPTVPQSQEDVPERAAAVQEDVPERATAVQEDIPEAVPEAVPDAEAVTDAVPEAEAVTDAETAHAIGCSMAAMVSTKRHLWLNLTGIRERDLAFLLDAPVTPSGLFGVAVNTVATRFWEVKRYEEVFVRFLPRRAQASGPSATQSRPSSVSQHFSARL